MATTYKADNYWVPMPDFPGVGVVLVRDFSYTITAAFIANDVVQLCKIPAGVCLDGFFIDVIDLDTDVSPTITLDLGDDDTSDCFVAKAGHTVGQAAGKLAHDIAVASGGSVVASIPVVYTAAKNFQLKVIDAPTAGVTSGVIKGWIRYHYIGAPTTLNTRPTG